MSKILGGQVRFLHPLMKIHSLVVPSRAQWVVQSLVTWWEVVQSLVTRWEVVQSLVTRWEVASLQ